MFRTTLAAIAFTAFAMAPAHALIIDDFNTTQTLSLAASPSSTTDSVTAATTSIIGGERDVFLQHVAGNQPLQLAFNPGSSGTLALSNGNAGTSISRVIWDGTDTGNVLTINGNGLGGIDLTEGGTQDAFNLQIVASDHAANITIQVFSGTNTSFLNLNSPQLASNEPFIFKFDDFFDIGAGADFANIGAIELNINTTSNPATDLELDFFGTTSTTQIPEPGILAILGIGLFGLGLARRRR